MPADIKGLTVMHYKEDTSDKFYAILPFPINGAGLALYGKNTDNIGPQTHVYDKGNANTMIGKKRAKGYKFVPDTHSIFKKVKSWIVDNQIELNRQVRRKGFANDLKITDFLVHEPTLDL